MAYSNRKLVLLCADPDCTCGVCGCRARFILETPAAPATDRRLMLCDSHLQELAETDSDLLSRLINGLAFWLEQHHIMILV